MSFSFSISVLMVLSERPCIFLSFSVSVFIICSPTYCSLGFIRPGSSSSCGGLEVEIKEVRQSLGNFCELTVLSALYVQHEVGDGFKESLIF